MQATLSPRQKAAVIVRLLLEDEDVADLSQLSIDAQTLLAEEMAGMAVIDRQTRDAVISEFCDHLEAVGVIFPGDLDGTLTMLDGRLSHDSADRLRRIAAFSGRGDPWDRIAMLADEAIAHLAESEAVEIVALMLSKLPVERASRIFSGLQRDRARAVAQAMPMTADVSPPALNRIGLILLQAAEARPKPALPSPAADRMGAILNFATADLRDDMLAVLDQQDSDFAGGVRKAIFIFAQIPQRIQARDISRIMREMDQQVIVLALTTSAPEDAAAVDFILSNLPQRMADTLRDERDALEKPKAEDIDDAMTQIVAEIRRLETAGSLTLIPASEVGDGPEAAR
ncbi:FliG C-terminal domain-containing protein [Paracoccus caeni]|nr:FliG C-terminal domain-containing protein [Paracoccus caeni]